MARKAVHPKEKITLVKCWVKFKNVKKAAKEVAKIQAKYN